MKSHFEDERKQPGKAQSPQYSRHRSKGSDEGTFREKYLEYLGSGPSDSSYYPDLVRSLADRHVESVEYYERANDEGNANHYIESYLEACSLSLDALDSLCLRSSNFIRRQNFLHLVYHLYRIS